MEKEKVFSKKIIALITAIMILSQVFSPLGLFMTVSKAASTPQTPAVVIRKSTDIQTSANGKWFQVQFAFVGDFWPYMFDLKLRILETYLSLKLFILYADFLDLFKIHFFSFSKQQ